MREGQLLGRVSACWVSTVQGVGGHLERGTIERTIERLPVPVRIAPVGSTEYGATRYLHFAYSYLIVQI